MATLKQIKEQKKSVFTINKITKAMKLVSSAKSQKAIKEIKEYRKYFTKIEEIMAALIEGKDNDKKYAGIYWILVMSDLGLAGGYNHNILKEAKKNIKDGDKILVLGSKGAGFARKNKNNSEWFTFNDLMKGNQLAELTTRIKTEHYDNNRKVKIIYTEFKSQIEFEPKIKTILPIQPIEIIEGIHETKAIIEYEPDKYSLLKELESLYIHSFIVGISKDAQASEHTARKNAMENATQNGEDLLEKLNIEYNRGRQAKITQEISEIIGGSESIS